MESARPESDPARRVGVSWSAPVAVLALVGTVASLVLGVGCARRPADPVKALLADLETAAEARDAERFAEGLSADFKDADGLGKPNAVQMLRRYFAAYETVALDVYGVEIERSTGEAQVRCIVEMSGHARKLPGLEGFLPPSAAYRFELGVADEDGKWRVRNARWESAEPPAGSP